MRSAHFEGEEIIQGIVDLARFGYIGAFTDVKWILDVGALEGGFSLDLKRTNIFPNAEYFLIEGNEK